MMSFSSLIAGMFMMGQVLNRPCILDDYLTIYKCNTMTGFSAMQRRGQFLCELVLRGSIKIISFRYHNCMVVNNG